MGVASFLAAVWRGTPSALSAYSPAGAAVAALPVETQKSSPFTAPPPAVAALPVPVEAQKSSLYSPPPSPTYAYSPPQPVSPCARRRVSFTLTGPLYAWLEAMAVVHNYGSVHKSVRDLLAWASTGQQDDMEWIFCEPHDVLPGLDAVAYLCFDAQEPQTIAEKQRARASPADPVTLDARVSEPLQRWVASCITDYGLNGPSDVLQAVCRCAIELQASDDIFESAETGHDLPVSTAELYHDLGIIGFSCHPAQSPTSCHHH